MLPYERDNLYANALLVFVDYVLSPTFAFVDLINKSRISPHKPVGLERDCHSLLASWIIDRFSGSVDKPPHKCACASFW